MKLPFRFTLRGKVLGLFLLWPFSILPAQQAPAPKDQKKFNLSLCAIFRNEAKYLKEWIEYHRLVGVDHFYLYNNNSTDRFREILHPYIKENIVTLINWPDCLGQLAEKHPFLWTLSTQVSAYENAARIRGPAETKWLVFVDIDEFLVPANANTLTEVLEKHREEPGVVLSSISYDASKINTLPMRNLIIETLELTAAPEQDIQTCIEKTIFKPELCLGFSCSPYHCLFKDNLSAVKLSKHEGRINRYVNRKRGYLRLGNVKTKLNVDNRLLSESEMKDLLETGYEIEDRERPIYRFMPEVLKKLGFAPRLN